jgi:sorbitol-specific phosphotransferase system component IIC
MKKLVSKFCSHTQVVLRYSLAGCFTIECIMKVMTFSFKRYMKERTNQLDFFIVVGLCTLESS